MLATLWLYVTVIGSKWWGLLGVLLFGGIAETIGYISPRFKSKLDAVVSEKRRRPAVLILMFCIFVYASFSAFADEHSLRVAAEAQRNRTAGLLAEEQRRLSAPGDQKPSPPPAPTVIHEPAAVPPAPLSRPIEIQDLNAAFDARDSTGHPPATMADLAFSVFDRLVANVVNTGDVTVGWQLGSWRCQKGRATVFTAPPTAKSILQKGERHLLAFPVPDVRIDQGDPDLRCSIVVTYDTIPSTGRRQTEFVYKIAYKWVGPQPNNNTVPFPTDDLQLVDRKES